MDSNSIWQERQNKPTYVAKDLSTHGIPTDVAYEILLRRGVFKWFAVRRRLIRLKDEWKAQIRGLNRKKTPWEKGYLKALEECRAEVRELCHSERWQVPDNDSAAREWLTKNGRR